MDKDYQKDFEVKEDANKLYSFSKDYLSSRASKDQTAGLYRATNYEQYRATNNVPDSMKAMEQYEAVNKDYKQGAWTAIDS